jgi:hypothetical protein
MNMSWLVRWDHRRRRFEGFEIKPQTSRLVRVASLLTLAIVVYLLFRFCK